MLLLLWPLHLVSKISVALGELPMQIELSLPFIFFMSAEPSLPLKVQLWLHFPPPIEFVPLSLLMQGKVRMRILLPKSILPTWRTMMDERASYGVAMGVVCVGLSLWRRLMGKS